MEKSFSFPPYVIRRSPSLRPSVPPLISHKTVCRTGPTTTWRGTSQSTATSRTSGYTRRSSGCRTCSCTTGRPMPSSLSISPQTKQQEGGAKRERERERRVQTVCTTIACLLTYSHIRRHPHTCTMLSYFFT